MTSRSTDSSSSRKERMTDEDVYQYALRVAYLSFLMSPKPPEPTPAVTADKDRERDSFHHSRLSGAISSSIYSMGDLFKDMTKDGQRSVKFPEKTFKVLDTKMQNIAMGKDVQYTDQYTRRVIAVFWGSLKAAEKSTSKEPSTSSWRQIKDNRKIEELILFFVTTATQTLRKDTTLVQGDAWKAELDTQIAQFVLILRDCLRSVNHVPPEITSRLDMYTEKLTRSSTEVRSNSVSRHSIYSAVTPSSSSPDNTNGLAGRGVADMPLAKTLARLFGKSDDQLQRDIIAIKKFCTEKAALIDLKTCLKNVNADMPFPGRRDDFETNEGYMHWRTQELAHLSQLMVIMIQFNPSLAGTTSSDPSTSPYPPTTPSTSFTVPHDETSPINGHSVTGDGLGYDDLEVEAGDNFTYIPSNPKKYYKRLLELCVQYDLEAMVNLPEDQEVSLGILSPRHLEVVNECALRWRVTHTYRVICFLDVIRYKYERDEVPIECIPEGLHLVSKAQQELPMELWPRADEDYACIVHGGLFNVFLGVLYEALEDVTRLKPDHLAPYLLILDEIRDSGLVERYRADIDARIHDLADRVRVQAVHQYTDKASEVASQHGGNRAVQLLLLTDHLEKQAKLLDKRFPKPLLDHLDLVALSLENQIPLFLTDLDHARVQLLEAVKAKPPTVSIPDVIALFQRTRQLLALHNTACPECPTHFDLGGYFGPYVLQWLVNTDLQTTQWVYTAISVDKFEPEGDEGHSSSILDLFENLKSPVDFLLGLVWPDPEQEARFFTRLSKTIAKLIEEYCRRMEDLFMEEMFPRPQVDASVPKQYAFIERAKLTISGEKKVEPFNFQPSSLVKLNNIEAARRLLDQVYARIDVDKITKMVQEAAPPVEREKERYLFTVKVVQAEGLVPTDASNKLDTFVTLSDEKGNRLSKTRTIYESLAPRWDETFDISVETSLWLMASVRDRAIIGSHDTVGRGYMCLDPRRFGDFLAHDLWLDLDPVGRILVRISMEGEKDDAQFYFGRAFRSLKRTESDMVRVIVDKMSPIIRQYLSRGILTALIKSTIVGYDYNKALAGVTGLYRSAIGADKADSLIPAVPQKQKGAIRPETITPEQMEDAIAPLFDYLDVNFATLNSSLSTAAKETVMIKVWKEILSTIEDLLVPPLSDAPSDLKPLSEKEVDVVFNWLKFMKDFTYAEGEGPIPLEELQNARYRDILSIRLYYDWTTDDLMEECVRLMQQNLRTSPTTKKRAKTVYSQRNLGTIKARKKEKKRETAEGNSDMILRILRMRHGTSDFISQQFAVAASARAELEQRSRGSGSNKSIPPVPPLPS